MGLISKISNRLGLSIPITAERMIGHDLHARVDYQSLRVRSARHELILTPEALGTLFSLPAWSQGRALTYKVLDKAWHDHHLQVMTLIQAWWGYQPAPIKVSTLKVNSPTNIQKTGLAFSLGVDSMYSCFFESMRPDMLVLVGGFDVPWGRGPIFEKMAASTKEIADLLGMDWTLVETNLRLHNLLKRISWEKSYGAAVSFVGMTLSQHIDKMMISSSMNQNDLIPHGSHPNLDALWGSSCMQICHVGQEVTRLQKMERLIDDPVSRQVFKKHIRVCLGRPSAQGNCGECRKCILLKLSLLKLDAGFVPDSMPDATRLDEILYLLPPLTDPVSVAYRKELLGIRDTRIDRALRDYICRSEHAIENLPTTQ
jgi:hypothetical protein